ncbi:MAG: iron-containing alcohol dehydrogenase [Spirochaetaceae bacterium]|jgi:alcohol dehydrogenase|nr:iron-containing alcohol dehydrogenase [Spirochaetaceae bacterium]
MMNPLFDRARSLLTAWKQDAYRFGLGAVREIPSLASGFDGPVLAACNRRDLAAALQNAGLPAAAVIAGAKPNTPKEDAARIAGAILRHKPALIAAAGGGSTIDACKAASVLAALGSASAPDLEGCFGMGLVSKALEKAGARLTPVLAVQTSASSGAHLTKYANVTDTASGQKKLIVDEALTPARALFDYEMSASMPRAVTVDGALDAVAHCFEVLIGIPEAQLQQAAAIAAVGIDLALEYAPRAARNPQDLEAREGLGLATDLGGFAIMTGGTGGGHLTSFSLVGAAGHGTACGIMNPYYAVFFAPKIEGRLRLAGNIFKKHGYSRENLEELEGTGLGLAVAKAMTAFNRAIGAPSALGQLAGFQSRPFIARALEAAKDPQLEMKLKNMPFPLTAGTVDEYMEPILRAAVEGDFSLIKPPAGSRRLF